MTYLDQLTDKMASKLRMDRGRFGRLISTIIQAAIIILPGFLPLHIPFTTSQITMWTWDTVESLSPGDYIMVDCNGINPSNFEAESGWRGIALFNHMHVKGLKLIVFGSASTFPMFWEFFKHWTLGLHNPTNPKYGKDWVFLRNFPTTLEWALRFVNNGWDVNVFPEMRFDDGGRDVTQMPIYWKNGIIGGERAVKSVYDIKMVCDIEGPPDFAKINWKIALPYPQLKLIFGGAVAMSMGPIMQEFPDIFNGMIAGLRGAGEYESLLSAKYGDYLRGPATGSLESVSIGLVWYAVSIIYLNVDEYTKKRRKV